MYGIHVYFHHRIAGGDHNVSFALFVESVLEGVQITFFHLTIRGGFFFIALLFDLRWR